MEKQLPLFAYELTASAQQTIREALTLWSASYANPAHRLRPSAQYVTGYGFS